MGYKDLSNVKLPFGKKHTFLHDWKWYTLKGENDQKNRPLNEKEGNKIRRVIVHWSGVDYETTYDVYHYCLAFDAKNKKPHVFKTLKLSQMGKHAYLGNTGSIGFSFMAMWRATKQNYGPYPITREMLDVGARFVAEFCCWHGLDPYTQVTDHAEVDKEIRGDKWDIGVYWAPFRELMLEHYKNLKANKTQFMYKGILN